LNKFGTLKKKFSSIFRNTQRRITLVAMKALTLASSALLTQDFSESNVNDSPLF